MISLHEGQGPKPPRTEDRILQLRLTVVGCRPSIWRRIQIRESLWLSQLHDTIQLIFDWFDYQTHSFTIDNVRYGNPLKREGFVIEDDRDIRVADLDLENRNLISYAYHFGEGWQVEIAIEKALPPAKTGAYPRVIEGERAGPPEDCGGIEAFHDMLVCIQEPHTDIGREWIEWLGPEYDAQRCDIEAMNKALKKLPKR